MNRKEQFAKSVELLKKAKQQGDSITSTAQEIFAAGSINSDSINAAIDYAASASDSWREQFNAGFNKTYGKAVDPLKKFSGEELEKIESFAVTRNGEGDATIGNVIQTNILTAMDDLYKKDSILSKIQLITDTNSYQMPEFGLELEADRVAEEVGSTSKDDVPRSGDTLTLGNNTNKLRSGNVVSRLTLESMNPTDLGIMQARITRSMMKKIEREVFNGTNATGQACGLLVGDSTFGAAPVTFSTVAGTRPINHIDALNYLIQELPAEFDDADLSRYVFALNRRTKNKITRTVDVNNNFYFDQGSQSTTSLLDGTSFYTSSVIANDVVGLVDLSDYYGLINAMPNIEVRELDNEMFEVKSVCYFDGGIRMAYKDAVEKNAHRVATLKADYTA